MQREVGSRFNRSELAVLAVLFSATVIVGTGIQMGNALFPALSRLMDVPVSTVTLLVSVWAFAGLLSPLFGPPSDRYGHGTFALIGLGAFTLGNLLCALAPSFPVLVIFQVIVGLGYAIFSFNTAAVVGDVFAYEARARACGRSDCGTSDAPRLRRGRGRVGSRRVVGRTGAAPEAIPGNRGDAG
jgi:predicted MFS family arabinose efflux permease